MIRQEFATCAACISSIITDASAAKRDNTGKYFLTHPRQGANYKT